MPDPITADQLAERKRRVCEEMGPNSFVASLTGEQWDHIIVCLREHESRAETVAKNATVEPVSNPYKLHWAWYGNDHVCLTAELEIVGVVHLPQSGSCIEYPWRCGSVVGTALCIGDARAAVEKAVRNG